MTEPPTVRGIEFQAAWPPVRVIETTEERREHAQILLLTAGLTVAIALTAVPDLMAVVPGFIAGYALCNWLVWEQLYDRQEVEN
jgi:Flp pilus assembly protein TadB